MRIIEQEEGPASAEDYEVFRGLLLAGSGKVRTSVDERMLCIESKNGHALDIKINSIFIILLYGGYFKSFLSSNIIL